MNEGIRVDVLQLLYIQMMLHERTAYLLQNVDSKSSNSISGKNILVEKVNVSVFNLSPKIIITRYQNLIYGKARNHIEFSHICLSD